MISSSPLHAADLLLIGVLVQTRVKALPPLKQHRVADELEPGSELQRGVLEELLEVLGADVLSSLDFVGAGVEIDVSLNEQDVVDYSNLLAKSWSPLIPFSFPYFHYLSSLPSWFTYSHALPTCRHWEPCSEYV